MKLRIGKLKGEADYAVVRSTISSTNNTAILTEVPIMLMNDYEVDHVPLLSLLMLPRLLVQWLLGEPCVADGRVIDI